MIFDNLYFAVSTIINVISPSRRYMYFYLNLTVIEIKLFEFDNAFRRLIYTYLCHNVLIGILKLLLNMNQFSLKMKTGFFIILYILFLGFNYSIHEQ